MKYIFFLVLQFMGNAIYSQNTLVEYDVDQPLHNITNRVSLVFNDTISVLTTESRDDDYGGIHNGFFMKHKIANRSYSTMRFMNISFNVWDSLYTFKWELLPDTINILGQRCSAAKTDFRGRTYIAYYSTNYATTEGPWKFGGLPGLILDVKSTDNYVEYRAVKIIENYTGEVNTPNLNKINFLDWESFVADYKKTVNKYIKLVKSNENYPSDGSVVLKLESIEIFYPELQTKKGIVF